MSGSGATKRDAALKVQCAKLARLGLTHRQIALTVGKRPEAIKPLIAAGERLLTLRESA